MHFLLTGATGFLGSYLAEDLVAAGHDVSVLLRPGADTWRIAELLPRLNVIRGDLDDIEDLKSRMNAVRVDGVAHMAWGGVGNADRNSPAQARNVPATVDLVALAADAGAKVFVGAGSQAEYGPYSRAISEDDLSHPTTLYGKAKLAAGSMAAQVAEERKLRFAWLRIFSTYGPKDADYWLIPSFIKTIAKGERMSLTGCEQKWGFLHARDAAAAFRTVLAHPEAHGVFNVGDRDAPPLRETLTRLRDLVGGSAELGFGDIPYRPDQVMILQADVARLHKLGWTPRVSMDEGLRETVDWYARS